MTQTRLRTGHAPFRAHARLIRLLGEELISDETIAIVELVKNSYDADAQNVQIILENVADADHGTIRITDDGSGMSLDTVLHSWLEPAMSRKRPKKGVKSRTPLGRIPLGEKGIGRFAVDKLGSELELVTRTIDDTDEVVLEVSWQNYEQDTYLEDIKNVWSIRSPECFHENRTGTILTIHRLRTIWDKNTMSRLHDGLVRLISPFLEVSDFNIEIVCPEFPEIEGPVVNRLLDTAPYRLSGHIDEHGILVTSHPQNQSIDLCMLNREYFTQPDGDFREPTCGPFSISLNVWDLDATTGKVPGVSNTLRKTIKARSGVSIYRDGFRVLPYGERDDDWLELNQRRVNNPTLRVSNNQVIGFVEITHSQNSTLRDRTSREGLLEGPSFFDLKALVISALTTLESLRFERRHGTSPRTPATTRKDDPVLQYLYSLRGAQAENNSLTEIERLYRARLEQEKTRYNQVIRLAGIGMAAELMTDVFAREVNNTALLLHSLLREISDHGDDNLKQMIAPLTTGIDRVNEQLDLMYPLYRSSATDNEVISVQGILYDMFSLLSPRLVDSHIKVQMEGQTQLSVHMSQGHLMQVIIILIENSIAAMKDAQTKTPLLSVNVVVNENFKGIIWSDNGPGIAPGIQHLIFQPYFSTRRAGRGLGLSVAKDILATYGATLELSERQSDLSGACFEIKFDGRRVSKTQSARNKSDGN